MFPSVSRARAVALAALGVVACAGRGGRVDGVPAADRYRERLIATVTIAPVAQMAATVDELGRKLRLPFTGEELARTVAVAAGFGPDAPAHLDARRPFGVAFVAVDASRTVGAMAITARDDRAADALVAPLGQPAETREAARRFTRADGKPTWVLRHGTTLVSSDTHDGLVAAGALAVEAQRARARGEVTALVYPPAIARSRGKSTADLLGEMRAEFARGVAVGRAERGLPPLSRGELVATDAAMQQWMQPVADSDVVTLVLDVDAAAGVRVSADLLPRAGTKLSGSARAARPFVTNPGLVAGPDLAMFTATTGTHVLDFYEELFAQQAAAGFSGAGAVAADLKRLRALFAGTSSFALRSGRGGATCDAILQLAPGVAPDPAVAAVASLASSPATREVLTQMYAAGAPQLTVTREGSAARIAVAFPAQGDEPGDLGRAVQALFGAPRLDLIVTGAPGQLTIASEPGARVRVGNLAAGGVPAREVSAALADAKGATGLVYVDAMGFARPVLAAMMTGAEAQMLKLLLALPGVSSLKLPVHLSHRGGATSSLELRVPLSTLANAAGLLQPFAGKER